VTRDEYMGCVRDLTAEVDAAQERGDEDGRLGAVMALDAFLSVVRPPGGCPACGVSDFYLGPDGKCVK
jgi:hypothetical protein